MSKRNEYRIYVSESGKDALREREGGYVDRPEAVSNVRWCLWTPTKYSSRIRAMQDAIDLAGWLNSVKKTEPVILVNVWRVS